MGFALLFLPARSLSATLPLPEQQLTARAALLIDAGTGEVLYEREADLPLPPASTTKIVTALVVLESGKLKEKLTVRSSMARVPSSKLGLRRGQVVSVEDLLYAVLLASANDASIVLAEGIGGSVERFAEMMTEKAKELGAKNTNFTNPHGLTAPGHHSTARDLATIFAKALKNPAFRKIVQTKTSTVDLISPLKRRQRVFHLPIRNHNRLLWSFDGAIGGKTGYTHAAQKCFVGGATRNGRTLIVSILGSRDLWGDTRRLLEFGFRTGEDGAQTGNGRPEKPKAAPPVDETPEARSPASYVLQIGSFRERERAKMLQRRVIEAGYLSYVETVVLREGGIAHRVRVGPPAELEAAQRLAREIELRSGLRPIIVPSSGEEKGPIVEQGS